MERFKEGELVHRRVWDNEISDWRLLRGEMWLFIRMCDDRDMPFFGEFLSPDGEIIHAPHMQFVDDGEAMRMKNLRNHFT